MIKLEGKKYIGYFYANKKITSDKYEILDGYSLYEGYGKIKNKKENKRYLFDFKTNLGKKLPKLEEMIINTGKINFPEENLLEVRDFVLKEITEKIKEHESQDIYIHYFGKKIKREKLERYGIIKKTCRQLKIPFNKP